MIEGVLFDSGGVLVQPKGGRWWPRYGFEEIVLAHHPGASFAELEPAVAPALRYLDSLHGTGTEDWREFYRIIVEGLGVPPTAKLLDELATFDAADLVELFDDVVPCLTALAQQGVRMAVVSDAWPNLPDMHAKLGIRHFFQGYAISAELGCTKPDPRMYETGARALGLSGDRLLFIDDAPDLVEAAIALGFGGVCLRRTGEPPEAAVPWVSGLAEFVDEFALGGGPVYGAAGISSRRVVRQVSRRCET